MQTSVPNYFSPNQDGEHHPKKVLKWIIIILIILGVGFLVYKKFGKKEYSFEEKMEILNSLDSGQDTLTKEQKEQVLEGMGTQEEKYSEEQKLDILNNL